jgi:hypothetical protein
MLNSSVLCKADTGLQANQSFLPPFFLLRPSFRPSPSPRLNVELPLFLGDCQNIWPFHLLFVDISSTGDDAASGT